MVIKIADVTRNHLFKDGTVKKAAVTTEMETGKIIDIAWIQFKGTKGELFGNDNLSAQELIDSI